MIIKDASSPESARVENRALSVDLVSRELVIRLGIHEYILALIALIVWVFFRVGSP